MLLVVIEDVEVGEVNVGSSEGVIKFAVGNVGQILEEVLTVEGCASLQDSLL